MFASLFSFSSRNLSYHKFSRFSLRSQLHRPGDTKCNVLDLAECQNQFNHRKFLWLIHLDRLINYSYSFGKQPAARVFKNKNCCFPEQGNVSHHTKKNLTITQKKSLLKKNLTYSSIFKVYFMKSFAAAKASLVFIKVACVVKIKLFFMDWFYYNLIILIK